MKMITKTTLSIIYLFTLSGLNSQTIINAYAKVTNIASSKQLTLNNVNITNHTFTAGEKIVIMQMQDNVIGTNTNNNNSFGNLSAINSAGLYEVGIISSRSPATGTPTLLTLATNLQNTYNINANTSVQVITFRNMGLNYTTTANIGGLPWDGNVGGVIAFEVSNVLTLNHSLTANNIGFRCGSASIDADENCDNSSYRVNDTKKGYKGEGIYKSTTANHTNGRAKILNAGGGGSENNAGGGGGGNYTAGGNGGLGYQCTSGNSGYGIGGLSLSTNIAPSRIFMGGGGGGGQQNNGLGTNGGNGGGIILLKTGAIRTNTVCSSSITISTNGQSPLGSGNDGAGGGGAGGSIVIEANSYQLNAACPLTISSNGGNGGDVGNAASHGGGGGGGQGVVFFSIAQPTVNATVNTSNGLAGDDNSGGTVTAGPGSGSNNSGVMVGSSPLPIELINFSGEAQSQSIQISWTTLTEINSDLFIIEKSHDGINFKPQSSLKAAGLSQVKKNYKYDDESPLSGENYYRLKQTDYDQKFKYSWVIYVYYEKLNTNTLFPNPLKANNKLSINIKKKSKDMTIKIYEPTGKLVHAQQILEAADDSMIELNDINLAPGLYLVDINNEISKLIVM